VLVDFPTSSRAARRATRGKDKNDYPTFWQSPITQVHFVLDSKIESRHTANAVLKQAGLQRNAFYFPAAKVRDMTREHFHRETHPTQRGRIQGLILRFREPGIREAVQA
jgi:hypothetical protein